MTSDKIKSFLKMMVLFLIGGTIYFFIEILWRGYSHVSMLVLGGICFVLIGGINEFFPWELGLLWQSIIGAFFVTVSELITGIVMNIWLGLGVWDYPNMPFNFLGQICLPFSLAWVLLSCVAIIVDDYLRYWLFGEEKPHYTMV